MIITAYFEKIKNKAWPWSRASLRDSKSLVCSLADFQKLVEIERCRVHRNGGKFTLIVFKLEEIQLKIKLFSKLIEGISRRARISDQMGWYDHRRLGLILPETSTDGAQKFIQDLYRQNLNGMPKPAVDFYVYPLLEDHLQSIPIDQKIDLE